MVDQACPDQARVVVLGSCNIDIVALCPALPRPGETVLGRGLLISPGGKGANQALAAARAGARTSLIGALGGDEHSHMIRSVLEGASVDTSHVRGGDGPPGTALIAVDDIGGNQIVVVPGANSRITVLNHDDLAAIRSADVLVAQLEIPVQAVIQAATEAHKCGVLFVLNATPVDDVPRALLRLTDLLVVNELEAAALAGGPDQSTDAAVGRLLVSVPAVIVTLGAAGALYVNRAGETIRVPAPQVLATDSTAAGDTFTGALATAIGDGKHIRLALQIACAAASLCVEVVGAAPSIPERRVIEERLAAWHAQMPSLGD